ncbi:MAG TPA: hypothetical protein VF711_07390, partial [Acidimicrobiales bacterium]
MSLTLGRQARQTAASSDNPEEPERRRWHAGSGGWSSSRWGVTAGLGGLCAISLALRLESLGEWLWMDEGIAVGIAS